MFGNDIYLTLLNAMSIGLTMYQDDLCVMALEAAACLTKQDWANSSVKNSDSRPVECAVPASLLIKSAILFFAPHYVYCSATNPIE